MYRPPPAVCPEYHGKFIKRIYRRKIKKDEALQVHRDHKNGNGETLRKRVPGTY